MKLPSYSNRWALLAAFLCLLMTACGGSPDGAGTEVEEVVEENRLTPEEVAQGVLTSMDLEADPCQDFYRYACGGWVDNTEIPSDQTRWVRSFSVIQERNREAVREMLESAAANPGEPGTESHRLGTFYGSCMDEEAVNAAGASPLESLLAQIDGVEDAASLMRVTGDLQRNLVNTVFSAQVIPDFKDPDLNIAFFLQGGLGMPDRDYYVSEDESKRALLVEYEQHIASMFELLGDSAEEAKGQAAEILAFETTLAKASRSRESMRNPQSLYNKIDRSGLEELTPSLPWGEYLNAVGLADLVDISVATPEFFEALEKLVAESSTETLKTYLRWSLLNSSAGLLSSDLVDADFGFYGVKLQGQKELEPRWKRCVDITQAFLGEPLGKMYVESFFPGESKDVALEMIHDVEVAFKDNLPALAWMDDTTRERAVEKAEAVNNKIGYPDEWRDFSGLELTGSSFYDHYLAAARHEFDFQVGKAGKPVDPNEWGMNPQTVNAYYHPLYNEMVFPAGILQPPFFHRDFPTAMNYGAMGAVMGHELSHGFDDQGRKFAPDGALREWWEPEVSARFEERASCVADLYSSYEVEPGQNVNGRLTLGENIADLGGVKQAFNAYKNWEGRQAGSPEAAVEGLTNDQLFFVAFGQVWCGLMTPEQARLRLTTDSHSPPQFRVIGPMVNTPAFAEAFQCPAGSPMAPENRCEVW